MELKIIYDKSLILGEGPIWDPRIGNLYFVDILGKKLFRHHYEKDITNIFYFEEYISCIALTSSVDIVFISLESGIYKFDLNSSVKTFLYQPETNKDYRYNDGAVTPWGTWLLGSMNNLNNGENAPLKPDATLYELSATNFTSLLDNVTISNGIVFEGSNVYFIDSKLNSVRKFKYKDQKLTDETLIFQYDGPGSLDGMALSKCRKLFIANWGGSQILVFDLNISELIKVITVPAINPTSCVFGGPQMNELFITTSNQNEINPNSTAGVYCIQLNEVGFEEPMLNW